MVENGRYLPPALHQSITEYNSGWYQQPNRDVRRDLTIGQVLSYLKRHRVILFFSLTASMSLAFAYWLVAPRQYKASVLLEAQGYAPVFADSVSEELYGLDTRKINYVNTLIPKLNRHAVGDNVLQNPKIGVAVFEYLYRKPGFFSRLWTKISGNQSNKDALFKNLTETKNSDNAKERSHLIYKSEFLRAYANLINIKPIKDTALIEVSVTTNKPDLSQDIANAHAEGFINLNHREQQLAVSEGLARLKIQANELKTKINSAEHRVTKFAKKYELVPSRGSQDSNLEIAQATHLTKLLAMATDKRIQLESSMNKRNKLAKKTGIRVGTSKTVEALQLKFHEAEAKYQEMSQKFADSYGPMQELRSRIATLKEAIAQENNSVGLTLEAQYTEAKSAEKELIEQINITKKKANKVSDHLSQYHILSNEADSLRGLYDNLLKQIKQREITLATVSSNVVISEFAGLPGRPSSPVFALIMALGAVGGFGLGFIIAVIKDARKKELETEAEIIASTGLPSLGQLPAFSNVQVSIKRVIMLNQDPSLLDEAIPVLPEGSFSTNGSTTANEIVVSNTIKKSADSIEYSKFAAGLQSIQKALRLITSNSLTRAILITSPFKGDGKSLVITNVGISLAQNSSRTLIIDGNLRQGIIHEIFDIGQDKSGLVNYLREEKNIEEIISTTSLPLLDVIPIGEKVNNPLELLNNGRFETLIESALTKYDYILIDSTGVLEHSDATILSKKVNGTIMVVRAKSTTKEMINNAHISLKRAGARILGVVINDIGQINPIDVEPATVVLNNTEFDQVVN
jgi:polysaccharide biosynthesis transport protein